MPIGSVTGSSSSTLPPELVAANTLVREVRRELIAHGVRRELARLECRLKFDPSQPRTAEIIAKTYGPYEDGDNPKGFEVIRPVPIFFRHRPDRLIGRLLAFEECWRGAHALIQFAPAGDGVGAWLDAQKKTGPGQWSLRWLRLGERYFLEEISSAWCGADAKTETMQVSAAGSVATTMNNREAWQWAAGMSCAEWEQWWNNLKAEVRVEALSRLAPGIKRAVLAAIRDQNWRMV